MTQPLPLTPMGHAPRVADPIARRSLAQRLRRNLGWVFSAQAVMALCGLATLALTARALGAAGLGVLALIEAYVRICARLVHFEPWQALVLHGSKPEIREDPQRFTRLIGLSVLVDLIGGLAAGALVLITVPILAPLLGLDPSQSQLLSFAAVAVVLSLRATGIGLLRLADRFDLLARLDMASAAIRLGLSALAYFLGAGLAGFVAVFILCSLIDGLAAFLFGWRGLRHEGLRIAMPGLRGFPGFLRLTWNANLAVLMRQTTERFDVVILALLVTPTALGYYHIARRCGMAALRLGRPLKQVFFPEFTRLAGAGQIARLGQLTRRINLGFAAALAVGLAPVLWHLDALISGVFGPDFLPARPVVAVQAVAVALSLAGVLMAPALLALGRDREVMRIGALTAGLFFALLVPLVWGFGVIGAALAHLLANALWLGLSLRLLARALRAEDSGQDLTPQSATGADHV